MGKFVILPRLHDPGFASLHRSDILPDEKEWDVKQNLTYRFDYHLSDAEYGVVEQGGKIA